MRRVGLLPSQNLQQADWGGLIRLGWKSITSTSTLNSLRSWYWLRIASNQNITSNAKIYCTKYITWTRSSRKWVKMSSIPTRTGRMTLSSAGHGNISFTPSRNGWNLPIRINLTQNYGHSQGQIIPWSILSLSLHTTFCGSTYYLPSLLTHYILTLHNFFSVLDTWHLSVQPPLTMSHTPVILTYIIYLFYQHGHFSSNADSEDNGNNLPINTASAKKTWTFSNSAATHFELRNSFMVYLTL